MSQAADSRSDDPIEVAWSQVEASWDDDAVHRKFLALCQTLDRLEEAGKRYRDVRESDPARSASAQARIDELIGRAMGQMQALRTEPNPRPRRVVQLIGILLAVLLFGFAISFFID